MEWRKTGCFGTGESRSRARDLARCGFQILPQHFLGAPAQLRRLLEVGFAAGERLTELADDEGVERFATVDLGSKDLQAVKSARSIAAASPALDLVEPGQQRVPDLAEVLEERTGLTESFRRLGISAGGEQEARKPVPGKRKKSGILFPGNLLERARVFPPRLGEPTEPSQGRSETVDGRNVVFPQSMTFENGRDGAEARDGFLVAAELGESNP